MCSYMPRKGNCAVTRTMLNWYQRPVFLCLHLTQMKQSAGLISLLWTTSRASYAMRSAHAQGRQGTAASPFHRSCNKRYSSCLQLHPRFGRVKRCCASKQGGCSVGSKLPVVLLPGFLQGSIEYNTVALTLESLGHATTIAQINKWQWLPTLQGKDFMFYLEAATDAVLLARQKSGGRPVAIVGHSAGGWLARLLLGTARYCGRNWDLRPYVSTLLTLGSPHLSQEAYPFGRVQEHRPGEPAGLLEDVRGSSLRFTNYYYTTAQALTGVQVICVAGTGIHGRSTLNSRDPNTTAPQDRDLCTVAVSPFDAWMAGACYAANCGDATVDGDGVCPTSCAILPGARTLLLPGVWHTAAHEPWYGSPEVVKQWAALLEE